jgi:hypothetical protein
LIRRHRHNGELVLYRCYSPDAVPLRELVRVAAAAGPSRKPSRPAKGLAGLDQHQVRRWISWRRWALLAMIAHALLAVVTAGHAERPRAADMIGLTCNEIRRLFTS